MLCEMICSFLGAIIVFFVSESFVDIGKTFIGVVAGTFTGAAFAAWRSSKQEDRREKREREYVIRREKREQEQIDRREKREEEKLTREKRSRAQYLAVRVVRELEEYISECSTIIEDKEGFFEVQKTKFTIEIASCPIFTEDIDWMSIDHEEVDNIISLQTTIRKMDKQIKSAKQIPNYFENQKVIDLFYDRYIFTSYEALQIVTTFRNDYKLRDKKIIPQSVKDVIIKAYKEAMKKNNINTTPSNP